jgi:hypothetical protein
MATVDTPSNDELPRVKRPLVKVTAVLMAASLLGSFALLPYSLSLMKQANVAIPPGISQDVFWIVALGLSVVIESVMSAIAIALGLWLGSRVGLGVPQFEAWLVGDVHADGRRRHSAIVALALGLAVGVVIVVLAKVTQSLVPAGPRPLTAPAPWEGFLASIGAGVKEELWFRFGLTTLLVWIGAKLTTGQRPTAAVVWVGNVVAALFFGALHLPQAASLIGLTGPFVVYVLLLNGVGGVAFGWLYWRHGLFAAMLAHFSTDVVLKVILPLLHLK